VVCPRRGRVNEKNWVDHNKLTVVLVLTLLGGYTIYLTFRFTGSPFLGPS